MAQRLNVSAIGFAVAIGCFPSVSSAADYGALPNIYEWSGHYLGLHGGVGSFHADVSRGSLSPPNTAGSAFDGSGGLFGLLGGINLQSNRFVYGVEADAAFGSFSGTNESLTVPSLSIKGMASLRGRAGLAHDRFLFFGTAGVGVAWADATEVHGGVSGGSSATHVGLVAGLGVEYAHSQNLTFRAEYLHGFLGSQTYSFPDDSPHTHSIDLSTNVFRGAVIWKFPQNPAAY